MKTISFKNLEFNSFINSFIVFLEVLGSVLFVSVARQSAFKIEVSLVPKSMLDRIIILEKFNLFEKKFKDFIEFILQLKYFIEFLLFAAFL